MFCRRNARIPSTQREQVYGFAAPRPRLFCRRNARIPSTQREQVYGFAAPVRVLVIDDIKDVADSLQLMLDLVGYETRVAYTGDEGLRLATAWCPDVVLCDIGLPGLTGYDLARALRGCPATAHARLIAITGYGFEEDRRRALACGFDHHFPKPVDPAALLQVMPGLTG